MSNKIYNILKELDISYVEYKHPAVYTCEEAEKYCKNVKGGKSKNLLLRNKKGNKFYLVVAESSKKIDLKKIAYLLEDSRLSFASPEQLMQYLKLMPGSVSPFGLINNCDKDVVVIIDEDLYKHDKLHFHPNENTSTLEITTNDLKKFLDWCGNKVVLYEL